MENLLKTAHLPSAQMDVFAFLLQAVADHLMWPSFSTEDDKEVFNGLVRKNKEIQGRGYRFSGYKSSLRRFAIALFIDIR